MREDPRIIRAREVFDSEIQGLAEVRDALDDSFLSFIDMAVETVRRNGKLVLAGVGKSGHIARKMAATLASTGSPAVFLHPVEALHGDLGLLSPNDLFVAVSFSGETDEVIAVLPAAKRLGVPIVAITRGKGSTLDNWSELVLSMPITREACPFNLAPTTSTTALAALGDAIALVMLQMQGFGQEDYARLHPAGAIGRAITLKITDVMRKGDRLPLAHPDDTVHHAILVMTRKRAGAVLVVDDNDSLKGIFTDGDLRRHITDNPHLMDVPVKQVMTTDPTVLHSDSMAVEVLNLLEKKRIDDVPVIDRAGRAVGLVDTQDLPKFKLL